MSIFIIHSHKDKDFVDQLATKLAIDRVPVFVDRWEINVGDSIIEKINQAITSASFLLVVLSKNSVESDWCKREIQSGLVLELEKKRAFFLPVLIEDCTVPLFLRDKHYVDFRESFNAGYIKIQQAIAPLQNEEGDRMNSAPYIYIDFAKNWGLRGEYFELTVDVVEFSIDPQRPFTILTNMVFIGNKEATHRFHELVSINQGQVMPETVLHLAANNEEICSLNAYIDDTEPFESHFVINDPKTRINFNAFVTVKRLGMSDGKSKIYYLGKLFAFLAPNSNGDFVS